MLLVKLVALLNAVRNASKPASKIQHMLVSICFLFFSLGLSSRPTAYNPVSWPSTVNLFEPTEAQYFPTFLVLQTRKSENELMENVFIYKPIHKKFNSKLKFKKKLNGYEISPKVNANCLHLCTQCMAYNHTFLFMLQFSAKCLQSKPHNHRSLVVV